MPSLAFRIARFLESIAEQTNLSLGIIALIECSLLTMFLLLVTALLTEFSSGHGKCASSIANTNESEHLDI